MVRAALTRSVCAGWVFEESGGGTPRNRAGVAQSAEQRFCKPKVGGSIPLVGSNERRGESKEFSGQLAEWLMAADCKSAALRATEVRILHCPPSRGRGGEGRESRGSNSGVESQPSKLLVAGSNPVSRSKPIATSKWRGNMSRQRCRSVKTGFGPVGEPEGVNPLGIDRTNPVSRSGPERGDRAPEPGAEAHGLEPSRFALRTPVTLAHVAQSVERVLGKDEVTSSILVVGSNPGIPAGSF